MKVAAAIIAHFHEVSARKLMTGGMCLFKALRGGLNVHVLGCFIEIAGMVLHISSYDRQNPKR